MKSFLVDFKDYIKTIVLSFRGFLSQPTGMFFFPVKTNATSFFLIGLTTFICYANTLGHQMAFDDLQAIQKNEFVWKGIRGIPEILNHDTYFSYNTKTNTKNISPGGRYRPLSIITFAIEQEFVGTWHKNVPERLIWDVNGNGIAEPDEDLNGDKIMSPDDFFERGMGLRHFNNILIYLVGILLIYMFLIKYANIIKPDVIFLACLLFTVHPIHTEVVANIKSRDELFSLFFIFLSLLFVFRFVKSELKFDLLFFGLFSFFALLSKEYAIMLPLLIIVSIITLNMKSIKAILTWKLLITLVLISLILILCYNYFQAQLILFLLVPYVFIGVKYIIKNSIPALFWMLGFVFFVYLYLRFNATVEVGNYELFNSNIITNPFLLAKPTEVWATKIFICMKYLYQLFYPQPLICDYNFNSIPYRSFIDYEVWVSITVYLVMIISTVYFTVKPNKIGFPLAVFLIFLLPVSNLILSIGATMGERFIFHSSIGFCLMIAWPLHWLKPKGRLLQINYRIVFLFAVYLICAVLIVLTIKRNKDWENNITLFDADYPKVPNNINLLHSKAYNNLLKAEKSVDEKQKKMLLQQSIYYIDKGLQIDGSYLYFYQTLAQDFYMLKEYDNAVAVANAGLKLDAKNFIFNYVKESVSKEYIILGINEFKKNNKDPSSIKYFNKAIKAWPNNTDAYYNKAYVFKEIGDTINAIISIKQGLKIEKTKQFIKLLDELSLNKIKND
jgi:hypothetical protein